MKVQGLMASTLEQGEGGPLLMAVLAGYGGPLHRSGQTMLMTYEVGFPHDTDYRQSALALVVVLC